MAQIKFKRGPSSNITSLILEPGEPAVTEDSNKVYIGKSDGTKFLVNPDVPPTAVTSVAGRTGAIVLNSADVGLGNVNNTSDANKPVSTAQQTALNLRELKASKGVANGYAPLDSSAKLPLNHMPDIFLGQVLYGGTWNAATAIATLSTNAKTKLGTTSNTITLTNNTTVTTGYVSNEAVYYITSTSGTFASTTFDVGDWLISIGTGWKKIDNTDAVTGVKGGAESTYRIGNINITPANVGAEPVITASTASTYWSGLKSFVDFATSVRAAVLTGLSTSVSSVVAATDTVLVAIGKLQAQVTLRAPLASPTFTGTPKAPTATNTTNTTQIATTAFVKAQGYLDANSIIDGGTF